LDEVSTVTR